MIIRTMLLLIFLWPAYALAEFWWPRGNDFSLTFESVELYEDNKRNRSEEIELISELMQAKIDAQFTSNRSTLILIFNFKDNDLFELICNQSVGSNYQCVDKEDPSGVKTTYNIKILTSLGRLTGIKLRGEDNYKDDTIILTLFIK